MRGILLIITALLCFHEASANTIEGEYHISRTGLEYIEISESTTSANSYMIIPQNATTRADLKKLVNGDQITASGRISNGSAYVDAINFVRLNNFMGFWENKTDGIQLNVTSKTRFTLNLASKFVSTEYLYALTPSDKLTWSIYLLPNTIHPSTSQDLIAGIFTFNNAKASSVCKLTLFEPDTNKIKLQTTLLLKR